MPNDPIRHIVLLVMENRSFDHMLGGLAAAIPGLDGVNAQNPALNYDAGGRPYRQAPTTTRQFAYDPKHEHSDVVLQLQNQNSGFVLDFEKAYPQSTEQDRQEIMNYFQAGFLPALHPLAGDFTVCDRWYCSVPGPTWPNRFFALSGTSMGQIVMPEGLSVQNLGMYFQQTQETIFDRLNQAGRKWKVYYNDFPASWLLLRQLLPENVVHYHHIDDFFAQVRDTQGFPEFVLLEPKYFGEDENNDHPPHNVMKGEKFIADVYNALRSNPDLWNECLLMVFFDEHGGFYDHVAPPGAVAPDDHQEEYAFDQLGVRVPALLISPWVSRRVEHTQFDHTSLLKYLTEKWNLGPLGRRTAAATSIGAALLESAPRTDTVPFLRVPYTTLIPEHPEWERIDGSTLQQSLAAFASQLQNHLEGMEPQSDAVAARMSNIARRVSTGGLKLPLDLRSLGAGFRQR